MTQDALNFNGPTRTAAHDGKRLGKQLATVLSVLQADGGFLTFAQIAMRGSIRMTAAASISARLRDLRKMGFTVDRKRVGNPVDGLWSYRLSGSPSETKEAA